MTVVRLLALDGLYAVVGAAPLAALGLVPDRRALVRLLGLALLLGWAVVGIASSYLLVAGLAATVPQVALASAAVAAGSYALLRRVPAAPERLPLPGLRQSRASLLCAGLLAVYLLALLWRSLVSGVTWWDAWSFWVPKAMSIVYFGGLDVAEGGFTSFANAEYPPFIPALHALAFRFSGEVDATALPLQDWVLATSFLWALAGLLAPRVTPRLLWPSLLMLAVVPNFGRLVGALTGDEPLAIAFALAGTCLVLWRLEGVAAHGIVGVAFLAAVPLIKREGLFLALLLVAILALSFAPRLSRRQLRLASLALVPLASIAPWQLWLARHDVDPSPNYSPGDLLRPAFLADRADRLADVLWSLPRYFLDPRLWLLTIPLTMLAAVASRRRSPELARLVVSLIALSFAGVAVLYWIGRPELEYYLGTSAARIPAPTMFLCAALFPLLVARAEPPAEDPPVMRDRKVAR